MIRALVLAATVVLLAPATPQFVLLLDRPGTGEAARAAWVQVTGRDPPPGVVVTHAVDGRFRDRSWQFRATSAADAVPALLRTFGLTMEDFRLDRGLFDIRLGGVWRLPADADSANPISVRLLLPGFTHVTLFLMRDPATSDGMQVYLVALETPTGTAGQP